MHQQEPASGGPEPADGGSGGEKEAAPTATPAADASIQDQEPLCGGSESAGGGSGGEKEAAQTATHAAGVAPSTPAGEEEGAAQKATLAADASIEGVPEPAGVSQVCISPSPGTLSPGGQYQDILPSISEEEHVGEPGQGCS